MKGNILIFIKMKEYYEIYFFIVFAFYLQIIFVRIILIQFNLIKYIDIIKFVVYKLH